MPYVHCRAAKLLCEVISLHCRAPTDRDLPFKLPVLECPLEAVTQELGNRELIDIALSVLSALSTVCSCTAGLP